MVETTMNLDQYKDYAKFSRFKVAEIITMLTEAGIAEESCKNDKGNNLKKPELFEIFELQVLKLEKSSRQIKEEAEAAAEAEKLAEAHRVRETSTGKRYTVAVNAIRPAIAAMHNEGNYTYITKSYALNKGVVEGDFETYSKIISELYAYTCAYIKSIRGDIKHVSKEMKDGLRESLDPIWRRLLSGCNPDSVDLNLYDEHDVDLIIAAGVDYKRSKVAGSIGGEKPLTEFRRRIEFELGLKMAKKMPLSQKVQELIVRYEAAQETRRNLIDRIDGSCDEKGNVREGLHTQLTKAEGGMKRAKNALAEFELAMKNDQTLASTAFATQHLNMLKSGADVAEKGYNDTNNALKSAEKQLTDTNKYLADNKAEYEKQVKTIKLCEENPKSVKLNEGTTEEPISAEKPAETIDPKQEQGEDQNEDKIVPPSMEQ